MGQTLSTGGGFPPSERRKYPHLRALVEHPVFGLVIATLILLSVVLLVVEALDLVPREFLHLIDLANEIITITFAIELFLRWLVSRTTRRFLGEFWLDLFSLIPLLRVFRLGRIFGLVRMLRVFSLAFSIQRRASFFGGVIEGRLIEVMLLLGFMGFALIFGTVGFVQFEVGPDHSIKSPVDAFWKALFSLLSNQYADYPDTLGGRVVMFLMSLIGVSVFAMLTGTVSAMMIEKLKENSMQSNASLDELHGHLVICGYSPKVAILIDKFAKAPSTEDLDIVLVSAQATIAKLQAEKIRTDRLLLIPEDFTRADTLRKAAIDRARVAVILSEAGENRSTEDIDARTMLAALTIEKLNPGVRTCAEMYHSEYTEHLKSGGVDRVVIQGEFSGALLAHSAMDEGTLPFFRDLISTGHKNELVLEVVPDDLVGRSLQEALNILFLKRNTLVVGLKNPEGVLEVNPKDRKINKGDRFLVIRPAGK